MDENYAVVTTIIQKVVLMHPPLLQLYDFEVINMEEEKLKRTFV